MSWLLGISLAFLGCQTSLHHYDDFTTVHADCSSNNPGDCMACALQGEAANQTSQGIYAVGVTIMTRAKGKLENICKVTKARGQFEGMRKRGKRKISRRVRKVTRQILKSREKKWTHFWAPRAQKRLRRSKPFWATHYEKRRCEKQEIGDHIFYNANKCELSRRQLLANQ
ncbi:MAG: cell wall hydrolase [Bdellovibrionales bacterium]|nr:cell wall hydrolase [Bdellovibrionales bacterium]